MGKGNWEKNSRQGRGIRKIEIGGIEEGSWKELGEGRVPRIETRRGGLKIFPVPLPMILNGIALT